MYDQELSRRLSIMKFSRATSRVRWLKDEKTNVSRTISALVLRALMWHVSCIPARAPGAFFSPFNRLTRLLARENFIISSEHAYCENRVCLQIASGKVTALLIFSS
jgi:hypothetical protein